MTARSFFRYLSIFLAVLIATSSVLVLSLRYALLNPSLYKEAFDQSGIYQVTTQIVEDKTTEALSSLMKSLVAQIGIVEQTEENRTVLTTALIYVLNTLIDTQTERLVNDFYSNINFSGFLQDTINTAIDQSLAWLTGETEAGEFFQIIPSPEEVEQFQNSSLVDLVTGVVGGALGVEQLPECTSEEQEATNLALITDGQILQVTCTSENIAPALQAAVESLLPSEAINRVEGQVEETIDAFQIRPVLEDIMGVVETLANLKAYALGLRELVQSSRDIAVFGLLVSFILTLVSLYLSPKERFSTFVRMGLGVGVSILAISITYYLVISNAVMATLPLDVNLQFGNSALSASQTTALVISIRSIVSYIVHGVIIAPLYTGVIITVIFGVGWLVVIWLERMRRNRLSLAFDDLDDNDLMGDPEEEEKTAKKF